MRIEYRIESGPLDPIPEDIPEAVNCQLLFQLYMFRVHGIRLTADQALSSNLFEHVGTTIYDANGEQENPFSLLSPGNLVLANQYRQFSNGKPFTKKTPGSFPWKTKLHVMASLGTRAELRNHDIFPNVTKFCTELGIALDSPEIPENDKLLLHASASPGVKGLGITLPDSPDFAHYYQIVRIKQLG